MPKRTEAIPERERCIWVFGKAVQDVTVTVELDMLIRENPEVLQVLRIEDTILAEEGLLFKAQLGASQFEFKLQIDPEKLMPDEKEKTLLSKDVSPLRDDHDAYSLRGGHKYTLSGSVLASIDGAKWTERGSHTERTEHDICLLVPCEGISWGGGGINVCKFIRALAPDRTQVPIRYTDYAMTRALADIVGRLEKEVEKALGGEPPLLGNISRNVEKLMESNMAASEMLTSKLSSIFSQYSSETSLEVFLASISAESLLFRPLRPSFRRNWVFSSFRSATRIIKDKIIFRGKSPSEEELGVGSEALKALLAGSHDDVGAIVLNSVGDESLFKEGYNLYRRLHAARPDLLGVLAMTETMQQFLPWMIKEKDEGEHFPPFILIFNEEEAVAFADALGAKVPPFMRGAGDFPDAKHFAEFLMVVRKNFYQPSLRVYVTIGPRGSLGYDGMTNEVIHVSYFSRQGDRLYDTNGCGDAFCAAVTLLEWAKRNGYEFAEDAEADKQPLREMEYFMAVATATAYSKARDRRGRVDTKSVKDLLGGSYLGIDVVGLPDRIKRGKWNPLVDAAGRIRRPPVAKFRGVAEALRKLFRPANEG